MNFISSWNKKNILLVCWAHSCDIRDFKQSRRKILVRWREFFFFRHPSMPRVREFKIPRRLKRWKRRLKVYSRSFILYRDYSNSLTLSNGGEPFLRLKPCTDPSRQGNVKKITFTINGRLMGILRAYLCFISLIHATWWDDIRYGILFPFNCISRIWLYFSSGCRAWHRSLRLMMEWTFRNFQRMTKKG